MSTYTQCEIKPSAVSDGVVSEYLLKLELDQKTVFTKNIKFERLQQTVLYFSDGSTLLVGRIPILRNYHSKIARILNQKKHPEEHYWGYAIGVHKPALLGIKTAPVYRNTFGIEGVESNFSGHYFGNKCFLVWDCPITSISIKYFDHLSDASITALWKSS